MKTLRGKFSLRARLYLFSAAIITLFAVNVATHVWGSFARSESLVAYRDAVTASQLITDLEQSLEANRQQILVLATLRETTEQPLGDQERLSALEEIDAISQRLRRLGGLDGGGTDDYYRRLHKSATQLIDEWQFFYNNYNRASARFDVESSVSYNNSRQRLQELDKRQEYLAVQRSEAIDRTINLTDRITVIGFVTTIAVTMLLVIALIRSTNASLQRLKIGVQRFGSGDLTHRMDTRRDAGEIGELAKTFNDMSSKLQMAIDDVRAAKADADAANAAKSMFLANVSHELRTPLNAIIGYSEMLQDEIGDPQAVDRDQFSHDLGTIIFSGRQLLSLINDILDLSKIETGKMHASNEWFNPAELIFQVCDSLSPLVSQKNNTLKLCVDIDGMGDIHSDRSKLQQIVTNLFSNACKFTEKGDIRVTASKQGDYLHLIVADTGIGMTTDQQARVFDAFVQAEVTTGTEYGGTGLGLAIVKDFCQILGGDITLTSTLGAGSSFEVMIPVDQESDHASA